MYNGSMKMGRQISVFLELSGVVFFNCKGGFAAFGGFLTAEEGRLSRKGAGGTPQEISAELGKVSG
jgi:secreted PhoX family phosphatase